MAANEDKKSGTKTTLGIVSDTHGLVRPEALEALEDVELILHAGDVGGPHVLPELQRMAPVRVVRGNVDRGWPGARDLPRDEVVEAAGRTIYMIHDRDQIDLSPSGAGFEIVVFGHTHEPFAEEHDGVLWLNPGSIGPRRFDLPISLAYLRISGDGIEVEHRELEVASD